MYKRQVYTVSDYKNHQDFCIGVQNNVTSDAYQMAAYCQDIIWGDVTVNSYLLGKYSYKGMLGICSLDSLKDRKNAGLKTPTSEECFEVTKSLLNMSSTKHAQMAISFVMKMYEHGMNKSHNYVEWEKSFSKVLNLLSTTKYRGIAASVVPKNIQLTPSAQLSYLQTFGPQMARTLVDTQKELVPEACTQSVQYAKAPSNSFYVQMQRKRFGENFNISERCLKKGSEVALN